MKLHSSDNHSITAGINNQEKKKKHNQKVLLAKFKLNTIEVLISMALMNSKIYHD